MSLTASTLVWDRSRATGSALLVLLSLAERSNKDHKGVCWSKIESVARRTRLGRRQAQRAIAELVDLRELYVHYAYGRGGTNAFVVTCGRSREFVSDALVEHIGMSRELAESIALSATIPVEKGVRQDTYSDPGKGVTDDTLSDPERVSVMTPLLTEKGDICDILRAGKGDVGDTLLDRKGCHIRQERVTNPVEKGVTDDVPPRPPIRKNQHEPLENHDRRRRAPSPACAPAKIDDDDDVLELILAEFERQTGRQRKPADEVAARTLRGVAFDSVRRGIAKSVSAVGDGRVSSLRYCVPAIQEFERGRIHSGIGAAPRPVAVPEPEPDVDGAEQSDGEVVEYSDGHKTPIFAAAALFVRQHAAMHGEQPAREELRRHLLEVCFERGFDPGLVDAIYPASPSNVNPALAAIGAATAAEE